MPYTTNIMLVLVEHDSDPARSWGLNLVDERRDPTKGGQAGPLTEIRHRQSQGIAYFTPTSWLPSSNSNSNDKHALIFHFQTSHSNAIYALIVTTYTSFNQLQIFYFLGYHVISTKFPMQGLRSMWGTGTQCVFSSPN